MRFLNQLFPASANNDFKGTKVSLYFFVLFVLLMTWRSGVHFFFQDAGLHVIGNIKILEGTPDPNVILYRFGNLWGLAQIIICMINWVVIFIYRNLIPLMYLLWLVEWITRLFMLQGKELQEYFIEVAPGNAGTPYVAGILILFFLLSLRLRKS